MRSSQANNIHFAFRILEYFTRVHVLESRLTIDQIHDALTGNIDCLVIEQAKQWYFISQKIRFYYGTKTYHSLYYLLNSSSFTWLQSLYIVIVRYTTHWLAIYNCPVIEQAKQWYCISQNISLYYGTKRYHSVYHLSNSSYFPWLRSLCIVKIM